jgi:hypothetical protein
MTIFFVSWYASHLQNEKWFYERVVNSPMQESSVRKIKRTLWRMKAEGYAVHVSYFFQLPWIVCTRQKSKLLVFVFVCCFGQLLWRWLCMFFFILKLHNAAFTSFALFSLCFNFHSFLIPTIVNHSSSLPSRHEFLLNKQLFSALCATCWLSNEFVIFKDTRPICL